MARVNVYLPDDLARESREAGLNVSSLTQEALRHALAVAGTNRWLESLSPSRSTSATHDDVMRALDAARDELGRKGG